MQLVIPVRTDAIALLCHPYHRGGVTRWMVDAGVEWRRRGGECWFIAPRPRTEFSSGKGRPLVLELMQSVDPRAVPTIVAPDVGAEFELGTHAYRASVYAAAVMRSVPPGVAVLGSDDAAAWHAAALLRTAHPMIGVLHADDPWYYELAHRYAGSVSAFVAVSSRVQRRLAELMGPAAPLAARIPCGIPFAPSDDDHQAWPTNPRDPARLVWIGRMDEHQKRVSDLPRIAAGLMATGLRFQLDVIGSGGEAATIARQVRELGLDGTVRLHGWQSGEFVQSALRNADLLLLPSNFEGMPVAAMEALASGCAVVGSDACGLEEYAERPEAQRCLWIFPVGSVPAAVAAVREALQTPSSLRREAATTFAADEFTIARCMDRYAAVLADLPPVTGPARVSRPRRLATQLASLGISTARRAKQWLHGRAV